MKVGIVPFVGLRNPLLEDENGAADALQCDPIALPGRGDDCEFCVERTQMSRARSVARPI